MALTYGRLRAAVGGDGVGIRARTALEPLGGAGDKVFPPTYGVADRAQTRYAIERRRVVGSDDGNGAEEPVRDHESVVLDSVASQANRFELALLDAVRRGELRLPVTSADFRVFDDLAGLDRISDFEAPHRIFDAILRDSFDGDVLFRLGPTGRAITEATSRNAAAVFHHSPITLLFGGWDSTGPKGGRGAKYERAITSEVVAHDIQVGVKTGSRLDPLGIELRAGPLYEAADHLGWTPDEAEAARDDKGKPKLFVRTKGESPGRPSQVNHGNVTPSIDSQAGGVTAAEIVATTVLSFVQLRRLRFPTAIDGRLLDDGTRANAEGAARTALAALGLAACALAFEEGFDLRSRCVLVAQAPLRFELVGRGGGAPEPFDLTAGEAVALVDEAAAAADEAGLAWRDGELLLRPHDRLAELIRRSRQVTEAAPVAEGV